jgi:integrase
VSCIGLRWDCVDPDGRLLRVLRVAVEVAGTVSLKPYPKSKAGRRVVPLPPFVGELLTAHRERYPAGDDGAVFTNTAGGPLRRTLFRSRVWRPALVEAGLLGAIVTVRSGKYRAVWTDAAGVRHSQTFDFRRLAVAHLVKVVPGGLRFHDLRHSYATWLIADGVPVNEASTTLNRYTHASHDGHARLRQTLADFPLTQPSTEGADDTEKAP